MEEIMINGEKYVKESSIINYVQPSYSDSTYCVIRSTTAGVFVGNIEKRSGGEVEIANCRRIWFWKGAASLSELATYGVKCPKECKFSVIVPRQIVREIVEIIPVSETAKKSIDSVSIWRA